MQKIDKERLAQSIGKHIERRCMELKMTHKQLAMQTGITEAGVSRYVTGQRLPRLDILLTMADVLNCSVDYLLFGV